MIDVHPEFLAFLRQEYDRCLDEVLEQERENAVDRYNGQPYGDEQDGLSQVVARDVAETVDYMVISILRTIISGERVVEFVHRDVDAAHEATETIMHMLMDKQDGYRILHDWLKAGLLEKNAVAMTWPEAQPKKRAEVMIPAPLMSTVEVIEADPLGVDPSSGVEMFSAVILQDQGPQFLDCAVPNEEFYCSVDARNLGDAALKGRRVRKTLSDLAQAGFDPDEVAMIGDSSGPSMLAYSRDADRIAYDLGRREGVGREVWWHEEYARFDLNGDGIAELLYIQRSEDFKVFAIEEMQDDDDHPFEDWCPFPMQHRRIGQSLADKVMDIERINTVLLRQSLDGIYLSNSPSTYVHEDSIGLTTVQDLLSQRAGRLVRWKGAVEPRERQGAFDPAAGFQMLEYMNRARETRTGITRLNMGLDEDTLNQTAKGQAQLIARGEQVEEYVARNFANAVARLITKKAKALQRYGKPVLVPIDGEYREVDPSRWPEDMIARARVGLGASRKDQRLAFRREVIGMQAQAMQSGLSLVGEQELYNSAKGFIADAMLGDVNEFFREPPKGPDGQPLPPQEQPDPEVLKIQSEMQLKQQELELKKMEMGAKLQLQQAEAQARLEALRAQGAAKAQVDAQKAVMDSQIAQARASFEADLAERQLMIDAGLKAMQAQADVRRKDTVASDKFRDGGDLSK